MCLAVPGKVLEIYDEDGLTMGRLDYGGVENKICLAYVPDIKVGDYAIVHAGFAISILDEGEARKSLELWQEIADLTGEKGLSFVEDTKGSSDQK